jgi:TIR domain
MMCDDLDPSAVMTPREFSASLRTLVAGRFTNGQRIPIKTIRSRIRVLHTVDRIVRHCDSPDVWPFKPFLVMPASVHEIEGWLADGDALPDPVSLGRFLAACLVPADDIPAWQEALHRAKAGHPPRWGSEPRPGQPLLTGLPGTTFLCHSWGDKQQVRELYRRLTADGVRCWLDEENLIPGQDWEQEIRRALQNAGFVLACLSRASLTTNGFVRRELDYALDRADEQPAGTVYLIPVRLEPCEIPDRLHHLHHVDLFEPHGYVRLFQAIRHGPRIDR